MATPRKLFGNVVVFGTDAEDIGHDEHPSDNYRPIDQVIYSDQGWIGIEFAPVKWGGECRVEVDLNAIVLEAQDNAFRVSGAARFFEGASEDTDDLEDEKGFEFIVPRTIRQAPPTNFTVSFVNSTVIGAEDHAEVVFSLSNLMVEDE